jgi:hypothetical protein
LSSIDELETDDATDSDAYQWPDPPLNEAYYGVAGEIVRTIEPHTEADPVAVLASFLVGFGNLIGRRAYSRVEGDRHHTNLFATLVGASGKGRKGTSWGRVAEVLGPLDQNWFGARIVDGLSTGEGLIWSVRDAVIEQEPIREGSGKSAKIVGYQDAVIDAGIDDKRLMIQATEFAGVLKVLAREANTLSAVLRQSWDKGKLRIMTRNNPACATDAHISMLAHVTKDDLAKYLNATDTANGFANRFLWLAVKRSKLLPHGGALDQAALEPFRERLVPIVRFASQNIILRRDGEADELWEAAYRELSESKPGLLGAATNRGEAQVLRLSMIYALLDGTEIIGVEHLQAALAVWDYAERSAAFIFGRSTGRPDHEKLLAALRVSPGGLTLTEVSVQVFARHKSSDQIAAILKALQAEGSVRREVGESSGGRRPERWVATDAYSTVA